MEIEGGKLSEERILMGIESEVKIIGRSDCHKIKIIDRNDVTQDIVLSVKDSYTIISFLADEGNQ